MQDNLDKEKDKLILLKKRLLYLEKEYKNIEKFNKFSQYKNTEYRQKLYLKLNKTKDEFLNLQWLLYIAGQLRSQKYHQKCMTVTDLKKALEK